MTTASEKSTNPPTDRAAEAVDAEATPHTIATGHEGSVRDQWDAYIQRVRGGEMGMLPALAGVVVVTIVFFIATPFFITKVNIANLMTQTAALMMLAMALTFDEFGMWLHLGGSYWQRASFDAVINRHLIGLDKLCWECDFPHNDSNWPESRKVLADAAKKEHWLGVQGDTVRADVDTLLQKQGIKALTRLRAIRCEAGVVVVEAGDQ